MSIKKSMYKKGKREKKVKTLEHKSKEAWNFELKART